MATMIDAVRQQWDERGQGPRVDLFHGARVLWNLYDQQRLAELASREPWFNYHPVVSDDATFPGAQGYVGTAAAAHPEAPRRLALVAGSTAMVRHTISELISAGTPRADIRYEDYAGVEDNSSATGEDQEEVFHEHR